MHANNVKFILYHTQKINLSVHKRPAQEEVQREREIEREAFNSSK
jgi:hypothetical protein